MKLIDKDVLVAEINRQQRKLCLLGQSNEVELRKNVAIQNGVYYSLLSFLDTLEVKEVDLEKIINDYFKDWKFDDELDIMVKPNNYSASFTDLKGIAKHFYELGLKAQKG